MMSRAPSALVFAVPSLFLLAGWSCEGNQAPTSTPGRECIDAFGMGIANGSKSYFAVEGLVGGGATWAAEARQCVMRRPQATGGLPADEIPENYCTCTITECETPTYECTGICRDNVCRQRGCEDWRCCTDRDCTQCRQQGEDGRRFVGRGCTEEQATQRAFDLGGEASCALTQIVEGSCRRL